MEEDFLQSESLIKRVKANITETHELFNTYIIYGSLVLIKIGKAKESFESLKQLNL